MVQAWCLWRPSPSGSGSERREKLMAAPRRRKHPASIRAVWVLFSGDDVEEQGHQRGAGGLPHEAGRGEHAAGRSAALGGAEAMRMLLLGDWKSRSRRRRAPGARRSRSRWGASGKKTSRKSPCGHGQQSHAAEQSGVHPFDEHAGHGGDDHDDGGPCREQQSGAHVVVAAGVLQGRRAGRPGRASARRNEQIDVATETEKIGMRSRSNGRMGYSSRSWRRMKR